MPWREPTTLRQNGWAQRVAAFGGRILKFENSVGVADIPPTALAELLLDFYLGEAERSRDEQTRNLAQLYAGQLVATLALLRQ